MGDNKETKIKGFYSELKKLIENQNYTKVIKVCNKILTEADSEVEAWQCKLTAQIHLGEFEDALKALKKCKYVVEQLTFEKAYCEYRLNKTNDALRTINSVPADSAPRIKELKAQILYRLEKYDDCFTIYRELVKTTSDQFDAERLTNLGAVSVNRIVEGSKERGPNPGSEATYEQIYNHACEILSLGRQQEALKLLQDAEALCRNILTQQEGASEEEINEEVAIIRVQQGHCLQELGREKEALSLYNAVLKTKPDDPALLAIVNNNIVAINRDGNVFDSKKRLKATSAPGLEHKLTSRQKNIIALNHCLFAYHTSQDDVIESEIAQLEKSFLQEGLSLATIRSAQLGRAGKLQESANVLKIYAKQHPENSLVALLSATQILLSQKAIEPAIELLSSMEDKFKFSNGIVSALVVLCGAANKCETASTVLRDALEWHRVNKSPTSQVADLCRQAANFSLRNGDPQTAASFLEELRRIIPSDRNALAQLISAYSKFDSATAQRLSTELPEPASLVAHIDAEVLESSFGPKYIRKQVKEVGEESPASPKAGKTGSPPDSAKMRKKTKKKKRKPLLPKNFVIGEEPDPERWLPKWQRKGQKKKRRNKEQMKGTQGISSDAADKYDITKTGGQQKTGQAFAASPRAESGYKQKVQKKRGAKKKKGQW